MDDDDDDDDDDANDEEDGEGPQRRPLAGLPQRQVLGRGQREDRCGNKFNHNITPGDDNGDDDDDNDIDDTDDDAGDDDVDDYKIKEVVRS